MGPPFFMCRQNSPVPFTSTPRTSLFLSLFSPRSSSPIQSTMTGGGGDSGDGGGRGIARMSGSCTHIHGLPEVILTNIFGLVTDVRSRNNMSRACRKWYALERSTRASITLRGNVRDLFLLPTSFSAVSRLDLSLLSPWGHPLLHHNHNDDHNDGQQLMMHTDQQQLIAHRLHQAFPNLTSLAVYASGPHTLRALAPRWPALRHASLVRWHQRPPLDPPGADLEPLFASCPSLTSIDLSQFYCWTEDIPAALQAFPSSAAALTRVDLLSPSLADGFRSSELVAVSTACPNLSYFRAPCVFNPMHFDFVGDAALLSLASNCPRLSLLHLVDPNSNNEQAASQDARISPSALEELFVSLPLLEDLAIDLCNSVKDAGPALEMLGNRCPKVKSLKLGQFQGICRAAGLHLDGVAVCGGLQSLCVKNSADLTDAGLVAIARGCRRLSRFEVHACGEVSEAGITRMASMLRSSLVEVKISGCRQLSAAASLRALLPVRDRIQRLHIDCNWVEQEPKETEQNGGGAAAAEFDDLDELEEAENGSCFPNKKYRYSGLQINGGMDNFWCRSWDRLRYLSLWLPAGELLSPLPEAGLEDCPELEEICIKIEGDCRTCPRPAQPVFGLSCLALYPQLSKMKLDCGDAIGYVLTAPMGQMDLSLWERFYLHGISTLTELRELDYWPPQDREVNQRSLSLPAAGLIQECVGLRKLFIHGTAHEHFMRFFLQMPGLRDVQLREDYYPAPENDMSTEMRVDSCSRFEDALNNREIPD